MKLVYLRCVVFATLAWRITTIASAQRGASYEGNSHAWNAPSRGFPGYFDTNVADKGSMVLELPPLIYGLIPMPSTAFDYGVTESLTVGTNALLTTLPWLFGAQGAAIKARSLLIGTAEHQSAATVYAGFLSAQGTTPVNAVYENATWNHSWRPASAHTITGHLNYLRLDGNIGKKNDLKYMSLSVTTFLVGVGYGYEISPIMGVRGMVTSTAYSSIDIMTTVADLSQTSSPAITKNPNRLAQVQFEYHTSGDWLVGVGAIHGYFSGAGATAPWLTFAFRM